MVKRTCDLVVEKAIAWWDKHRPDNWDLDMYLDNPTVAFDNKASDDLAIAVVRHIDKQRRNMKGEKRGKEKESNKTKANNS